MYSIVFEKVAGKLRNFRRLQLGPTRLVIACGILIGVIGYADYLTEYDRPLLLFYLIPISVAAWFGTVVVSLSAVIASLGVWMLSDVAAGTPFEGWWNVAMAFTAFVIFAGVLSKLSMLVRELDRRVDDRTAELQREMTERQRLDREIVQIADRERRRLGYELHDRLGQHLIGTAFKAQKLKQSLTRQSAPDAIDAEKVVQFLEEGIDLTRKLAHGFYSPELDAEELPEALQHLAGSVTQRFHINCIFRGDDSVRIKDSTVANELYRIAQEAVTNSVKHAAARLIEICLKKDRHDVCLTIVDDGIGLPDERQSKGIGLRLMRHRAELSGATFDIRRNGRKGTIATCRLRHIQPSTAH